LNTQIGDEGIICLINALAVNNTVHYLDIRSNRTITLTGWRVLSNWLRNPKCPLGLLCLTDCNMNIEEAIEIIMALVHNSCLIDHMKHNDELNEWPCQDICRVLCDTTCIESIYSSNHTLDVLLLPFYFRGEDILDEIASSLEMNHNEDKAEVARQKILKHHFSGWSSTNVHVFTRMPEAVMLCCWMDREKQSWLLIDVQCR
jgi:hypothetical protein